MAKDKELKIAISQFPVSDNIRKNLGYIKRHITKAASENADIIHFPELALSGYNTKLEDIEWSILQKSINLVQDYAKTNKVFVVFGVHIKNPNNLKPYNATIVVSDKGKSIGEYIKSRLYGEENDRFSKKDNELICEIKGVKCGFLICYESWFTHLFENYRDKGVDLLFLSFFNAGSSKPKNSMDELMRAQFITRSVENLMYISGSNSSSRYSRMPSSFVSPDGKILSARRHVSEIIFANYPSLKLGWTHDISKTQ